MPFILRLAERYFWFLFTGSVILVFYLNYYGADNQSFYDLYKNQANIITSGFDPSVSLPGLQTFPMWGYGWLYVLVDSTPLIMFIQNILMMAAIVMLLQYIEKAKLFNGITFAIVKLLVVLSLPWFAYHSKIWPNSMAINVFLIALILFLDSIDKIKVDSTKVIIAGILLGISLNFRSDYLLLPVAIFVVILICRKMSATSFKNGLLWLLSIYLMLAPWVFYTRSMAGHALLTSTNSGHVLFISLGNLPGNKWGIQPGDDDPLMHRLLVQQFGEEKANQRLFSVTYEADKFLKTEFYKRVAEEPAELAHKVFYNIIAVATTGTYSGRFLESPGQDGKQRFIDMMNCFFHTPTLIGQFGGLDVAKFFLQAFSLVMGRIVVFGSFIVSPLVATIAWKERSIFWLAILMAIGYQTMINVLMFHMPAYTTNVYLLHMLNLVQGGYILYCRLHAKRDRKALVND